MSVDEVRLKIIALIQDTFDTPLGPAELTPDARLLGQGIGLDSIEVLALVAAIETEFNLTIDDSELKETHVATLGSLVDFVRHRLTG